MAEKTFDECYWFHYDSSQDISLYEVGSFRCPPSYGYGPIIRDTHIMHYVVKGKGKLCYHGKEYPVYARQIFVIRSGDVSYYEADNEEPWEYIWIRFQGSLSDRLLRKAGITTDEPVFSVGSYSERFEKHLRYILHHYTREYDAIGTVYRLFQEMTDAACAGSKQKNVRKASEYVQQVLDYIQQKYAEPISIQEISDYCCLNHSYLCRIFQIHTGESPQQYLQAFRMQKAEQLLIQSSLSVQEVAFSVGYSDPFTFSKAFKRLTGVSPSAYRGTL